MPSWALDRYARFCTKDLNKNGSWKYFGNASCSLLITVTDDNQLVITEGTKVLESHCLTSARSRMRGLSRTDSLLFLYKLKNETRRFRVRFCQQHSASGIKICEDVIRVLSSFITIKMSTMENKKNLEDSVKNNKESSIAMNSAGASSTINITGEVTFGVMAKAVLNKHKLPLAYYQCQPDPETISVFLRTCLADPAFPRFVEAVEDDIRAIIADSSEKA